MKIPLILRCAARLIPSPQREEWMAEWDGELAYVRTVRGRSRAATFCLGAFQDAWWVRRSAAEPTAWRGIFTIESPARCLALLAILAAAGVFFATRHSVGLAGPPLASYRDKATLAMVSRHGERTPRFAEIPVAEYRASSRSIPGAAAVAFYAPRAAWVHSKRLLVAVASPNLIELLGGDRTASGLILKSSAWRRYFNSDPGLVGRAVQIAGAPAVVKGIVLDDSWTFPGVEDAYLLDAARFDGLPAETRGFMIARLQRPLAQSKMRWLMATPNDDGVYDSLAFAPMPREPAVILDLLLFFGMSAILLLALTPWKVGAYPASRQAPSQWIRARRWAFLTIKIALLLPIVLGGALALGMPQIVMMGWMVAARWALSDQRNRCLVCLHSLSYPVRIGEASHTFLDWYGTELVCARGHGLLHVAEVRTSCCAEQRWLYLDPTWSG